MDGDARSDRSKALNIEQTPTQAPNTLDRDFSSCSVPAMLSTTFGRGLDLVSSM